MRDIPLTLARQSYQASSLESSNSRLINCFVEPLPSDGKSTFVIQSSPGLKFWDTIGAGPIWGMHYMNNVLYVVSGNNLYSMNANRSVSDLGSLGTISAPVMMDDNDTNVVILTPGGAAYYATEHTLTQISDADFQDASSFTILDLRAVFTKEDSNQFFYSDLNDVSSYNALNFATAERESAYLVRAIANKGELWLFGEKVTEVWANTGNADFTFDPIKPATLQRGCIAKNSVVQDSNQLFWLGDDKRVYTSQGYQPVAISTLAIDGNIQTYSEVSDAIAHIHNDSGHKFYVLTFPTERKTWVYDIEIGLWHERESVDKSRWRVNAHTVAFGKNLVGDFETGLVYELDRSTYDEYDNVLSRVIQLPNIYHGNKQITFGKLHLDVESGVALQNNQGSKPQVMMSYSNDGGKVFSNERWRSLGETGENTRLVRWWRLGQARQRIFKFVYSDPTKFIVIGGEVDYQVNES